MKNTNLVMKRVCAYMIDIIVVMLISVVVTYIPFLKKNTEEYQTKYNEYEEKYYEYTDFYQLLESTYEDNEISEEEYNELIKEDKYKDLITSSYEDNKISQGEYKEITNKINEDNADLANDYNYILGRIAISDSIITLVCTLFYFGVIQYFLKGQTIGKKILKLKVVSASKKKINLLNYILRSLIVNNVLLNIVGIIFLAYSSKTIYLKADNILSTLVSVVEAIIIFLVLTRDDARGLHDLLFNTKVISTEEKSPNKVVDNNKKVIDASYKEEDDKDGKENIKKTSRRKK